MKFIWLCFIVLLPGFTHADAGFSIGRPKAPCYAVFTGIDKMTGYEFYKTIDGERDYVLDSTDILNNSDTLRIRAEGSRRWQGPIKILIRNKATQQFVDSFILKAEGYNLAINFTGVENNKPKYIISKTKAVYPYELFSGEGVDPSVAKRNKFILISLSALGFLTLAFMFYKRRNTKPLQQPENI